MCLVDEVEVYVGECDVFFEDWVVVVLFGVVLIED